MGVIATRTMDRDAATAERIRTGAYQIEQKPDGAVIYVQPGGQRYYRHKPLEGGQVEVQEADCHCWH